MSVDLRIQRPGEGDVYINKNDLSQWWVWSEKDLRWVRQASYTELKQQLDEAQRYIKSLKTMNAAKEKAA